MDLYDVSEVKSYLAYKSMDLSDVQTASTPTLLSVHGLLVEVLRCLFLEMISKSIPDLFWMFVLHTQLQTVSLALC